MSNILMFIIGLIAGSVGVFIKFFLTKKENKPKLLTIILGEILFYCGWFCVGYYLSETLKN